MIRPRTLKLIERATVKPEPFEKRKIEFWQDRYIRRHVLNAHLDPDSEDGSRKQSVVVRSVRWISKKAGQIGRLLDLGCGPGLYAKEFATLGWNVTGMDFAKSSVRFARRDAKKSGVSRRCHYIHGDYMERDWPKEQDVVTLIYGNYCVLSPIEQKRLLHKIRASLKPGGLLFLDAFTKEYVEKHKNDREWYVQPHSGFWSSGRHLVLQDSVDYPANVSLNRYVVIPVLGKSKVFYMWYHPMNAADMERQLNEHGFSGIELYSDLCGEPYEESGEWIGVTATASKMPLA